MYSHLTSLEFNVFVCFVFVYLFVVCLTSLRREGFGGGEDYATLYNPGREFI